MTLWAIDTKPKEIKPKGIKNSFSSTSTLCWLFTGQSGALHENTEILFLLHDVGTSQFLFSDILSFTQHSGSLIFFL